MKKFLLLGLIISLRLHAQQYVFTYSSMGYTDLTGDTVLTGSAPWTYATSFNVPIGFPFTFMSTVYTSVNVEGSGFTYFDANYYHLTLPFTVKLKSKGSVGSNSPISYKTEGVFPNRILKVQWKNAGFHYDTTSTINFQMWLWENNGEVWVHVGPNNVPNPALVYQENGSPGPVVGVYEYISPTNCVFSSCLSGNPATPVANNLTGNFNLFGTSINGTPPVGTIYIFDPNPFSVNEIVKPIVQISPNPTNDQLILQSSVPVEMCTVFDLHGTLVMNRKPEGQQLFVGDLPEGIYILEAQIAGVISRQKLVISR